jgi:hypothetical protein
MQARLSGCLVWWGDVWTDAIDFSAPSDRRCEDDADPQSWLQPMLDGIHCSHRAEAHLAWTKSSCQSDIAHSHGLNNAAGHGRKRRYEVVPRLGEWVHQFPYPVNRGVPRYMPFAPAVFEWFVGSIALLCSS